jgi:hypothetical protein
LDFRFTEFSEVPVAPFPYPDALTCTLVRVGGATPPYREVMVKADQDSGDEAARGVEAAASIAVPFRLRGLDGLVTVDRVANRDPRRWGYHLLGEFPMGQPEGFPVVRALVSYPAEGYCSTMGWIQLVYYGEETEDREVVVDLTPQHEDANTPYAFWGFLPLFFDAPSTPQAGIRWVAEAFLATSPDALMTKTVLPICGFRWGYTTTRKTPELLALEPIGAEAWQSARAVLTERYPAWEFRDAHDAQ